VLHTGLQDNIFKLLEIKTKTFQDINKYCVICTDEMFFHIYNISRDTVIGFENIGFKFRERRDRMFKFEIITCCNVVVMMVRGICESWKQPLSYFFVRCNENVRFKRSNHTNNTEIESH